MHGRTFPQGGTIRRPLQEAWYEIGTGTYLRVPLSVVLQRFPPLARLQVARVGVSVGVRRVLPQGAAGERHAQLRSAQLLHPPARVVVVGRRLHAAALKLRDRGTRLVMGEISF